MKRPHRFNGQRGTTERHGSKSTLGVTEFKTRCLELVQAVYDRDVPEVILTKRGKPLVRVVRVDDTPSDVYGSMQDAFISIGDITSPIDVEWDAITG